MPQSYDCADPDARAAGLAAAGAAVGAGRLVVLPTDTVYGLGADAFTDSAVAALLAAKGRGRDMPVPVLIGTMRTLDGIAARITDAARELVEAFWPGGLTIVCHQQPSLRWDLGDAAGTVAVRMPLHPVALDLLKSTGPMAVSSANRTGMPPATSAIDARNQLGNDVDVYLDGGPTEDSVPSTIVDVTGARPRVLRLGHISLEDLRSVAEVDYHPDNA
ncbi:MAG: threonylcarbamoyl-AMP synthase [Geodermatophilaceae bacterium]|uniref:L-threonylcarbamoyladenylate synthase n=1 Tax=Sporichthya sp. TaxID=65475 RepID=UPI0017F893EC|nr:L-threonylcarbamoyladenylate synthase [Sporichthya sp.]MBA2415858.1 threonylcarbamoyl-AMP synthase [Geodermatophilaceae bacterium]MBA3743112.1 threonylcarbamoyl-AMP synthase [Sporichthya sp.]